VIVKFGASSSYDHIAFLKRLLNDDEPPPRRRTTAKA
jgi:hypothetical protein